MTSKASLDGETSEEIFVETPAGNRIYSVSLRKQDSKGSVSGVVFLDYESGWWSKLCLTVDPEGVGAAGVTGAGGIALRFSDSELEGNDDFGLEDIGFAMGKQIELADLPPSVAEEVDFMMQTWITDRSKADYPTGQLLRVLSAAIVQLNEEAKGAKAPLVYSEADFSWELATNSGELSDDDPAFKDVASRFRRDTLPSAECR